MKQYTKMSKLLIVLGLLIPLSQQAIPPLFKYKQAYEKFSLKDFNNLKPESLPEDQREALKGQLELFVQKYAINNPNSNRNWFKVLQGLGLLEVGIMGAGYSLSLTAYACIILKYASSLNFVESCRLYFLAASGTGLAAYFAYIAYKGWHYAWRGNYAQHVFDEKTKELENIKATLENNPS